ncbi:unnamed protein product [Calypogeia fissa]
MDWTKQKPVGGSKYGLQLKISAPAAKKPQLKKPVPFSLDDDEGYTVEDDIARQASKKQSAHEVDTQIKQALQQDASAFDYDGVYDQMKGQQAQPIREDREKREPKYIKKLIDKAKVRQTEHDMAYERRLTKEREKEDHLYGDKDKFVTSAYKKKLIEMGKWKEEERLRELREQAHEVSGKKDLSDFYRNLLKNNVAFGAGKEKDPHRHPDETQGSVTVTETSSKLHQEHRTSDDFDKRSNTAQRRYRSELEESESRSPLASPKSKPIVDQWAVETSDKASDSRTDTNRPARAEQSSPIERPKSDELPRSASGDQKSKEEKVATARERYLARKKQRTD